MSGTINRVAGFLAFSPLELCDIESWGIRVLLERFFVFFDNFEHGAGCPPKERTDLQILVRIHLDVVDLWIPCHRRAGRRHKCSRLFWRRRLRNGQGPRTAEYDGVSQSVRVGLIFMLVLKEKTELPCWKNIGELAADCMD